MTFKEEAGFQTCAKSSFGVYFEVLFARKLADHKSEMSTVCQEKYRRSSVLSYNLTESNPVFKI